MRSTNLTEAEAIIAWIATPLDDRSPLSAKQMEMMERWNVADNLLREHMSERVVVPALIKKFGYSITSARRDLDCARRVWGTRPRADKDYLANMLIDYLTETMIKAGTAKKYGEVARLAKVIIEAAGIGKRDEQPVDPEALKKPVPIQPQYLPEAVGGTPMSELERQELMEKVMKKKRDQGLIDMASIAQFTELRDE